MKKSMRRYDSHYRAAITVKEEQNLLKIETYEQKEEQR